MIGPALHSAKIQTEQDGEDKWSKEAMPAEEKAYYMKCKAYNHITQMPLISISNDIFRDNIELNVASLVLVIDEDNYEFDAESFLNRTCRILRIDNFSMKSIQKGCVKVVAEIYKNFGSERKKIQIKAIYESLTPQLEKQLGKLKIIFMFMGDINKLPYQQSFRYDIKLYPRWNHLYIRGHTYWTGPLQDGLDRGNEPYYCPVGWKRHSFYVTEDFYEKFRGWCICYHGTTFSNGLAILLSGLTTARMKAHGDGVYVTPSIIYAAHPRYAEVKRIESSNKREFFENGNYIQFVLQCRVHPKYIKKKQPETLMVKGSIDSNIDNDSIEWVVHTKGKHLMDFNDPDSTVICTGLMIRITDNHPGLLFESQWWFASYLGDHRDLRHILGIDLDELKKKQLNGDRCCIIYE